MRKIVRCFSINMKKIERRHLNLFLVTAVDFKMAQRQCEEEIALMGIRNKCCNIPDVSGYDYNIRMELAKTLAENVDTVLVYGNRITAEMIGYIKSFPGDTIYAHSNVYDLLKVTLEKNNCPVTVKPIAEIQNDFVLISPD